MIIIDKKQEFNDKAKGLLERTGEPFTEEIQALINELYELDYLRASSVMDDIGQIDEDECSWFANEVCPSDLVGKARVFAKDAHKGQTRKMSGAPFFTHLEAVAGFVSTLTDDEEVIAAAWLHDVVEDTDVTMEEIEREFGGEVANYVYLETEDKRRDLPAEESWKVRKEEQIKHLENVPEQDRKVLMIALADKLANTNDLLDEYREHGDSMWKHFNNSNIEDQKWYYSKFAEMIALSEYGNSFLSSMLQDNVDELFNKRSYRKTSIHEELENVYLKVLLIDELTTSSGESFKSLEILSLNDYEMFVYGYSEDKADWVKTTIGISEIDEISISHNRLLHPNYSHWRAIGSTILLGNVFSFRARDEDDAKAKFEYLKAGKLAFYQDNSLYCLD